MGLGEADNMRMAPTYKMMTSDGGDTDEEGNEQGLKPADLLK